MKPSDHVRLQELIRRVDELCREAGEIRIALEMAAQARRHWPDRRSASRLFTSSSLSDVSPGSSDS